MGDPNAKVELTTYDKISVALYRSGIILSMLSYVFSAIFFYKILNGTTNEEIFNASNAKIVFWVFLVSVGVSISFLHLYSKQILRVIQSFFVIGATIWIALYLTSSDDVFKLTFQSSGGTGKIGTIALGFILAAFSGVGAKEAYCFRLYEGYFYGILNAILVLTHLVVPSKFELGILIIITGLVVLFTFRKLFLPIHYDIGDKTRY